MSFSVDKICNNFSQGQGIDVQAVRKIANQIFANSQEVSPELQNLNLTRLTRNANYGLDLYSAKTTSEQAVQTSIRNSDVDLKLSENFSANVQYLNSQAVQKSAETINEQPKTQETQAVKGVENEQTETKTSLDLYNAKSITNANELNMFKANKVVDVNLAQAISEKVQYLNSQAAKSQYTEKRVEGKIALPTDDTQQLDMKEIYVISASTEVADSQNLNKDRRGSNPFSFYMGNPKSENEENEKEQAPLNLIA